MTTTNKQTTTDAMARCGYCASTRIEGEEGAIYCHDCKSIEDSVIYVPALDVLEEMLEYFADVPAVDEFVVTERKVA
jgi:hypothetical protein